MKKKRFIPLIGTVLLLSTILMGLSQAQGQPRFSIGILDDPAHSISAGAQLAVQEINQAGGVIGADGTAFQLSLVVETAAGGQQTAQAIANLSAAVNPQNIIAVIGPPTTEEVLANLTTLQALNVPVLTPATGDTILASDSAGRLFRIRAAELLMGRALADYIVNDLGLRQIATVQMDLNSTAAVVGFSTSLSSMGVAPQSIIFESGMTVSQLANAVISRNPQIAVVYGPPDIAAELYTLLRTNNWNGRFAYNQVVDPAFRDAVPTDQLAGILAATTWSYASNDERSILFLAEFVQATGRVPDALAAASYDAVNILAEAIGLPGNLQGNLRNIDNFPGVQGLLSPAQLGQREMSNNVAVIEVGPLGGAQVVARYAGSQRLPEQGNGIGIISSPTPAATATPEGVVLTIRSNVQNVRTGPGLEYDILGQMRRDEQARVIGATVDFSWVVINYRGQNGWLATSLLDIFGDRSTVPVIQPPPSPTPAPPTVTPTPQPRPDIVITGASPNVITVGVPFNITVIVRNQGLADAGPYAIAATFLPDGVFSGLTLPGLGAGQQTAVSLTGTLNGATGIYDVVIVADLNQQVDEGPAGEANNGSFVFNYRLDRPVLNSGTLTLNPGGLLSLEGAGTADIQWNGTGTSLDFPAPPPGSGMYIMPNVSSLNNVHYSLIDPTLTNTFNLNAALLPNAYIAIITAEGNRGVMHVDSVVPGGPITLTYRVYQP